MGATPIVNLSAHGEASGLILNPKQVGTTEDLVRIELEADDAARLRKWLEVVFPLCDFCKRDCSSGYERTRKVEVHSKTDVRLVGEGVRCEPICAEALAAANALLEKMECTRRD